MIGYLQKQNKEKLDKLNLPGFSNKIKVMVLEKDTAYDLDFIKFHKVARITKDQEMHGAWCGQIIKLINNETELYSSGMDIEGAIKYCIDNGIRIINASMNFMRTVKRANALEQYYNWGGIFITTPGNKSHRSVQYLGTSEHTICVGATNSETSLGEEIDVFADSHWYLLTKKKDGSMSFLVQVHLLLLSQGVLA